MPTPGFPPGTLDATGYPIWLSELDVPGPNHTAHLVRDLEPARALEVLGADPGSAAACTLPEQRPDEFTSLPRAALGDPQCLSVLLATRIGGWTLVFDDAGTTFQVGGLDTMRALLDGMRTGDWSALQEPEVPRTVPRAPAEALSASGGPAVTLHANISGLLSLDYAVDGSRAYRTTSDDLDHETAEPPAEVRAAAAAAGIVERAHLEPGETDEAAVTRIGCALAGVTWTMDDLRAAPLLAVALT
ncbi:MULTISPECIES: hypothetical protein [unclassified Saccharopolyspora]|uniref:hypothetical protein n=1 Tax=unclassified Saccharopolyspora TaxID=2646250 RepID=UPI001CD5970E|nr:MULTISPECIES: hypothetical protein [unclassified Saccharopolyspora]MCA1189748.1 hypothetical protein [Saccharopolyspora sp. 6T]MCA1228669.1 hypothetical protein [Saccharopolyspora sp. 6M]MCA1279298.1 hypothetical protein [Saccharopolyspora sp. 7B]